MSLPSLHTDHMRKRILTVLQSEDPAVTPAARAAASSALSDPTALSDSAIAELAEALTHLAGRLGDAPDEAEPPDPAS